MARIFSINFTYQGEDYTAMVTVRNTAFYTEYNLRLDEELAHCLPGNKIISTHTNELIFVNATFDECTPLMEELLNAIRQHLQAPIS